MATTTGKQLAEDIRTQVAALKTACEGLDEAAASRAPEGRWSPKEILSHMCGPEGGDIVQFFRAFIDQDDPTINIAPEQTYFEGARAKMGVAELLAAYAERADRLAGFVETLSPEELDRKAHIPQLAGSPWGEHLSLEGAIDLFGVKHVQFHIGHMGEIREALTK